MTKASPPQIPVVHKLSLVTRLLFAVVSVVILGSNFWLLGHQVLSIPWAIGSTVGTLLVASFIAWKITHLRLAVTANYFLAALFSFLVWIFMEGGTFQQIYPWLAVTVSALYWLSVESVALEASCFLTLLLSYILGFQIVIVLGFPFWLFTAITTATTFATLWFWSTIVHIKGIVRSTLAIMFAMIAAQMSVVLLLWPINYFTLSELAVAVLMGLALGTHYFITHRITKKVLIQYLIAIALVVLASIVTSPWVSP